MIVSNLWARWHNYYRIVATADDPGYVMPVHREFHDARMSDAIYHIYELLRDQQHEWDVTIEWVG